MDVIIDQYFDLDIISDNFTFVLKGFGETLELSLLSRALALIGAWFWRCCASFPAEPWHR